MYVHVKVREGEGRGERERVFQKIRNGLKRKSLQRDTTYYNSGGEDLPAVLKADRRKRALCTLYDFYLGRKRR